MIPANAAQQPPSWQNFKAKFDRPLGEIIEERQAERADKEAAQRAAKGKRTMQEAGAEDNQSSLMPSSKRMHTD
ncbi:hypothetical protein BWQ96_08401 [Gracilariopsis chorda]|uniref:Uncharacterized protein n=1 Tax=Gracilariopsis chorda TaxID=448386 RepID=A0A2V3IIF2_9FLOR|nr:hypothetical protein BWQ96_08401 [Gracilariopsis chorda]|eukprot:PXF41866.1 hypothetical protein BWQ96_08401 [Gracilariopsis chorda]